MWSSLHRGYFLGALGHIQRNVLCIEVVRIRARGGPSATHVHVRGRVEQWTCHGLLACSEKVDRQFHSEWFQLHRRRGENVSLALWRV